MRTAHRNRRPRPPTAWTTDISGWDGNTPVAVGAAALLNRPLLSTGNTLATPFVERLTITRIVGEVMVENIGLANAYYSFGFIVRDLANQVDTLAQDPARLGDAELPWLFLKHGRLMVPTAGNIDATNQAHLPMGAHIDIKVKRIMRPDQVLVFVYNCSQASLLTVNVRTLIARAA